MGTVIRTACALGFKGMNTTPGSNRPFRAQSNEGSGKRAVENRYHLNRKRGRARAVQYYSWLKPAGKTPQVFNWPDGFLLAVGSEAGGLSPEIKGIAKKTVGIPIKTSMESLNAAVSAGDTYVPCVKTAL